MHSIETFSSPRRRFWRCVQSGETLRPRGFSWLQRQGSPDSILAPGHVELLTAMNTIDVEFHDLQQLNCFRQGRRGA